MKFNEFMVKEAIRPQLKSQDRDGVLRELVEALAESGAVPKAMVDELVAAVIKREKEGSTGFGKGVAVPHAKHPKIKTMVGTLGRSVEGIDFSALDKQPVHTVFLLLSPLAQPQQHVAAMNVIFSNLQQDNFRRFMRQSPGIEDMVDLLNEADEGK
ncbi:MAG: PTS sugar transporter subunit IIA [Tepidisphaeraceae bacterium]|jgi:mannitol/fructose-specific phosphotransferase system IIA component (Ntr-type)